MTQLTIRHFTDAACPWAFSAEPVRYRLRWHYGDALRWLNTMIVLAEDPEEYVSRGLTPAKLAQGMASIQRRYGMPIDTAPRTRMQATAPACRAVVAARLHAPEAEERLLRQLRVLTMAGALLDEPATIAAAAEAAGLEPRALEEWTTLEEVDDALRADMRASRSPAPAALALDHKLAGPPGARRYTAPSYELVRTDGASLVLPGFNPVEAVEAAVANLAPELERRPKPESAAEVLAWADEPLATAEVALLLQVDPIEARSELARVARPLPVGGEFYWTLAAAEQPLAA